MIPFGHRGLLNDSGFQIFSTVSRKLSALEGQSILAPIEGSLALNWFAEELLELNYSFSNTSLTKFRFFKISFHKNKNTYFILFRKMKILFFAK